MLSLPIPRTVQIENTKLSVLYGLSLVAVLVYCVQAFILQMQYTLQVPNGPRLTVSLPESDDHTKVAVNLDSHPLCKAEITTSGVDAKSGRQFTKSEFCVGMCLHGLVKEDKRQCMLTSDLHVFDGATSIWTLLRSEGQGIFEPNAPATGGTCDDPDPNKPGITDYQCPHPHRKKLTDVKNSSCENRVACNANCCELPHGECDETIYEDSPGRYQGCQSQTKKGWNCATWKGTAYYPNSEAGTLDHSYCRNADFGVTPWCYFEDDYAGKGWGECAPIEKIGSPTCGGTAGGAPCKFPFTYKRKAYMSCFVEGEQETEAEENELEDSDDCLQLTWGESYTCSESAEYCEDWAKDMHRCCPVSCERSNELTETECNALTSSGACVYPRPKKTCSWYTTSETCPPGCSWSGSACEACVDDYDLGIVERPWGDFQSCSNEAAKCHLHPDTLMRHCKKTCGVCKVSYKRLNAATKLKCDAKDQITSWEECKTAAKMLGLAGESVVEYGSSAWSHVPPGCWYWPAQAREEDLSGLELGFNTAEGVNNGDYDSLCRELPTLMDSTKADCISNRAGAYMNTTGCAWTSQWSCPGQQLGSDGAAENDVSLGYTCCCSQRLWEACSSFLAAETCPSKCFWTGSTCQECIVDSDCTSAMLCSDDGNCLPLCSTFTSMGRCPSDRCIWAGTACVQVPDEPWCFTTNLSQLGFCNCQGMEHTSQEPVAVREPTRHVSESWEIVFRSQVLAFMDAENYSFQYSLKLSAADVPFFLGLNSKFLSKKFTNKDCITFLVDSYGLPIRTFQPGDEIKIAAPLLIYAADGGSRPHDVRSLPAWVFDSGVSIDTTAACYTSTYDLEKNVNSHYDWDPHIREVIKRYGAACVLRVYITDRSNSRITESYVKIGETRSTTSRGILLRTRGSLSSYHRVYAVDQILIFFTSTLVLLSLPRKGIKYLVLNALGHLSKVYKQVVELKFDEEDQCVRSVMQACIGEASFSQLADEMQGHRDAQVSRERVLEVVGNSTKYDDIDSQEKNILVDFVLSKLAEVGPKEELSLPEKLKKSFSGLTLTGGNEDATCKSFSIGRFHAVTSHELMPLDVVANLFDKDRKRSILERFFLPNKLRRAIQGSNTERPSSTSIARPPHDTQQATSIDSNDLQCVAVAGGAEQEKINTESIVNRITSLEDTVRNLATEVANLTAWKNNAQTIDIPRIQTINLTARKNIAKNTSFHPENPDDPLGSFERTPTDKYMVRKEKDSNAQSHWAAYPSLASLEQSFAAAELRIGAVEQEVAHVDLRLEQLWNRVRSRVPFREAASNFAPERYEKQIATEYDLRHKDEVDASLAEQNRALQEIEDRLDSIGQHVQTLCGSGERDMTNTSLGTSTVDAVRFRLPPHTLEDVPRRMLRDV